MHWMLVWQNYLCWQFYGLRRTNRDSPLDDKLSYVLQANVTCMTTTRYVWHKLMWLVCWHPIWYDMNVRQWICSSMISLFVADMLTSWPLDDNYTPWSTPHEAVQGDQQDGGFRGNVGHSGVSVYQIRDIILETLLLGLSVICCRCQRDLDYAYDFECPKLYLNRTSCCRAYF